MGALAAAQGTLEAAAVGLVGAWRWVLARALLSEIGYGLLANTYTDNRTDTQRHTYIHTLTHSHTHAFRLGLDLDSSKLNVEVKARLNCWHFA